MVCLSVTHSLLCLGLSGYSSYQGIKIAAVLAVSIAFSYREYSLLSNEHFQMQMTLQIRAVLFLGATTKLPPVCVPIQALSTQPICISSSVLFDNLFQLHKGASKLCIAHFVKVIIERLILFCRCFYQIEDKSWFPILFCVTLLGITEGTNKNPFINKEKKGMHSGGSPLPDFQICRAHTLVQDYI
jgi:hypothetical protein